MKNIKYILVLFFAYFVCVSNVFAEQSDYVYPDNYSQCFNYPCYSTDFHNYTFENGSRVLDWSSKPLWVGADIRVDSFANIANTYAIKGSFTVNFYDEPILVPTGGLDSCLYLAQNSNNERDYLSNCFSLQFNHDSNLNISNYRLDIISSESISVATSDSGDVTVSVNEGYQYTFSYYFEFTVLEVNTSYNFSWGVALNGGYFVVPEPTSIVSVLITSPKIDYKPYFTAENSMFSKFFNELDFNFQGLTSIITAPLVFVNSLKNSPPAFVRFTVFNKNIDIANGETLFWNKQNVAQFRTLWNYLLGGSILYFVYKRLFHYVFNLFNPEKAEVKSL